MTRRFDVAVLGRAGDAAAVAAQAACALAAGSASRTAIVVVAGRLPPGPVARPGRGATRARDALLARGLDARGAGRIVWCVAGDPTEAFRATAVAVPAVLAVCRPRADWIDELLDDAEHALVAGDAADPLMALVLSDLEERGLCAAVVPPPAGVRAGLARLGLAGPLAWRAPAVPTMRAAA